MITGWRSALFHFGYNVSRQTSDADLETLIAKLRPADCGIELIRIGGEADGGYLVPNDLAGIEYCFSPGVSTVADFENGLAELGIRSFLADYSVDAPPVQRPEFVFDKKFLGATDHDPFMTLYSWKNKYLKDYRGDLLLQMDIEGAEYEVLLSTPDELLDQFRILVIEFHEMYRLIDPFAFSFYSTCFQKLLHRFHVVHIHPNNSYPSLAKGPFEIPRLMEFTFLNKKRAAAVGPRVSFPHRLDRQNVPGEALALPKCWYSPVATSSR